MALTAEAGSDAGSDAVVSRKARGHVGCWAVAETDGLRAQHQLDSLNQPGRRLLGPGRHRARLALTACIPRTVFDHGTRLGEQRATASPERSNHQPPRPRTFNESPAHRLVAEATEEALQLVAEGEALASEDYPELAEILQDRPPLPHSLPAGPYARFSFASHEGTLNVYADIQALEPPGGTPSPQLVVLRAPLDSSDDGSFKRSIGRSDCGRPTAYASPGSLTRGPANRLFWLIALTTRSPLSGPRRPRPIRRGDSSEVSLMEDLGVTRPLAREPLRYLREVLMGCSSVAFVKPS